MRVPLIMAILMLVATIAVNLYIYLDIRKNYPRKKCASVTYGIFAIAQIIFALVLVCMPRRSADFGITFQMWGFYSFLTVLIPQVLFCIFSLLGMLSRLWSRKGWKLGAWVGLPLGLIVFISMWWGAAVTRYQIEIKDVDIYSSRLPEGFNGYRIAQISDLHVGTWGNDTRFVERLVDSVNAQKPDIIFFTGDVVNRETTEMAPFMKALSKLHAPDGVYSILGNHDYGDYMTWNTPAEKAANLQLLKNWQKQIGWKMLNNESTRIINNGDTIQLIGVENWGEPPFHQYGHLTDAYPISKDSVRNLNDHRYKILLSHNPEHWRREVTKISNIDLTLSGHTHAMQIEFKIGNWKWSPAVWKYEEWGGLYDKVNARGDTLQIYTNIGAGEVGMPFRIGATPEITILTLRKK